MPVAVRWTVGDVSTRGWESLRLSVHSAARLLGPEARLAICVNGISVAHAKACAGSLPERVVWHQLSFADIPACLRPHLGDTMAEGTGWKLIPLRLFPSSHELSLDNDCILWRVPAAMQAWLDRDDGTLLAADVERCLGVFQDAPVPGNVNSGIRGLPPRWDFQAALEASLQALTAQTGARVRFTSELDEQGLQAAALFRAPHTFVVPLEDISICSPFWPRHPEPGTCGAHFVGLNCKSLPWNYFDRPGLEVRQEHWDRHRAALYRHAGLPFVENMEPPGSSAL